PHVAGSWAVLKSYMPDASVGSVLYALESSGAPITDTRNSLVKPRIDVYAALLALTNYESLAIRNLGYGDLTIIGVSIIDTGLARMQAQAGCDWLAVDAPELPLTISSDNSGLLGVAIDVCEGPGIYTKTIRITSDDPDESTVDVPVTLEVNGPLAVTLNWFLAEPNGGMVNFQWETTAEQGVAGFNLLALHDDQTVVQLNQELIPSTVIDSVAPTRYAFSAQTEATRFFLQEVSIGGIMRQYGPFDLAMPVPPTEPVAEEQAPRIWLPLIKS
ncbi:MAG: hypothetical protein KDD92_16730, partial [Caldilineaceae bacterium]|nr:hypothetical protein [Caldilineaceae bacterium]